MSGKISASAPRTTAALDVESTFGVHRFGKYDATATLGKGYFKKAFATDEGATVAELYADGTSPAELTVSGAAAEPTHASMVASLARDDGSVSFTPDHVLIAKLHRAKRGLRIVSVPWQFDVAMQTILGQRVTAEEAMRQFRRVAERYGREASGLAVFPPASFVAKMPTWQLAQFEIDPKRSRAMVALARAIVARKGFWSSPVLVKILQSIRGIGPWTIGNIMALAMGDPDALVVGDLHLPHVVGWALAQEPRGSDERMLELLLPFLGQRFRVTRLLMSSGIKVPRTR